MYHFLIGNMELELENIVTVGASKSYTKQREKKISIWIFYNQNIPPLEANFGLKL